MTFLWGTRNDAQKKSRKPKAKQLPKAKNPKVKDRTQIVTPHTVCVLCFFDVSYLIFPFCLAFGFSLLTFFRDAQNQGAQRRRCWRTRCNMSPNRV